MLQFEQEVMYTLPQTKVSASLLLCGATRSTPRLLSYVKKVGKDTPKTSWFLDFQQKGALPPLDTPSGTRNSRGKRGGA